MKDLDLHPKGDHVVRALGINDSVKLVAIRSTETVEMARKVHDLSPIATVALGRFMSGLQMMSQELKNPQDLLSGQISCDGPLKSMLAVAKQDGSVKAFVENPIVPTTLRNENKFDVATAVGNGTLSISRKQAGDRPYTGTVELVSGEIAEDLTYYLYKSEQIPTIVSLGVSCDPDGVKHAGGLLVQVLPDADDSVIDYLDKRISGFPEISFLLSEGFDPAQIINLLIGPDIRYLQVRPSSFACDCSRERMQDALVTLAKSDLQELAEDEDGIDLVCDFCNTRYHFAADELNEMIDE